MWWNNWNTHEYVFPHMSVFLWQNVSGKSVYNSIDCVLYHRERFSVQNHISHKDCWLAISFNPFYEHEPNFNLMELEHCIILYYMTHG